MNKKNVRGIIAITDDGQPVVTPDHQCPHFMLQIAPCLTSVSQCWCCRFADFRKTYDVTLHQSVCRCPQNWVNVIEYRKNQQFQQPFPLTESFVSNIKGGIITCIFNNETQSSKAMYINAGWTAITGYTMEDLNREKGGNPQALIDPEDQEAASCEYARQLSLGNEYTLIYRVIHKSGITIWVIDRGVANVLPNGDIQNQSIVTEVTGIKKQEEHFQRLAQLDQLTALYNKVTFMQQAQIVLNHQCDKLHAAMILDVDDFKQINDTIGHAYGDKVLKFLGDYLKGSFRPWDILGRIGGDEFMILMVDVCDHATVDRKAEEVCAAIRNIKIHKDNNPHVTVSLGIALSHGCKDFEKMFKYADTALYQAKKNGKNQHCLFDGSFASAPQG